MGRLRVCVFFILISALCRGDAGVLIPTNLQEPDSSVLSLDEMSIDVRIDNGQARVAVREIFGSHSASPLEGNYVFALPGGALVSDFAVWDGVTRIPGVILERKRAQEVYNDIRLQSLDPGLLQMGERDADEAGRSAVFTARIVPIPAYGSKRLELEYRQRIPVERLAGYFALPLRPDAYRAQAAGRLTLNLELDSAHALRDFQVTSKAYAVHIDERTPHRVRLSFEGRNVALTEDFALRYTLAEPRRDELAVLTHRDPGEPGFFEASDLLAMPAQSQTPAPKTVIALFDNSLSMQWEKLERSYRALEALLRSLHTDDRFNLLLFNTTVVPFSSQPVAAAPDAIEKALDFVKASRLQGGTNVQAALTAALAQSAGESYIVLLGDGGATRGAIQNGKLAEWYAAQWRKKPVIDRPRTYIFAVGDDANLPLVRMLARNDGVLEWVRSTEPVDFKLNAFLAKIGRRPVDGLQLTASPPSNFDLVYPLQDSAFAGSVAAWVGQYKQPAKQAVFTVRQARIAAPLPATSAAHPRLPREWAKARVDALLEKIEREGEDQAAIDEIIKLARKYKFVTPYTSFLAAPRALLRPRLIRPGDPVLRVKTDRAIVSVVAMFPFGLIKKLRYLQDEDTWQTRFLAPPDLSDGSYRVRLILRDRQGHVYKEAKTFTIASRPPVVRVKLDRTLVRRGETVRLRVAASKTTRTIVARLYGTAPLYLHWNPQMKSNTGDLFVPASLPAGKYKLTVTAEDFAHNIGSSEVPLEVAP
jgi:Ca-activated chloride channel family protein